MFAKRHPSQKELYDTHYGPTVSLGQTFHDIFPKGNNPNYRIQAIGRASLTNYLTTVDIIHSKIAPADGLNPKPTLLTRQSHIIGVFAPPVRRLDIMDHSLRAGQNLIAEFKETGGDRENLLARLGNLAAFGVVLSHFYEDGNGTTARVLGHFIRYGHYEVPRGLEGFRVSAGPMYEFGALSRFDKDDTMPRLQRYRPIGNWSGRGIDQPEAFLDHVAASGVPFDHDQYQAVTSESFLTPYPIPEGLLLVSHTTISQRNRAF